MPDRLQRLLSSIANQHNISLIVLIGICIAISLLPFYSSTLNPTLVRKSNNVVAVVVNIDMSNYSRLHEEYLKLNISFHDLRSQVIYLSVQSKHESAATPSTHPTTINQEQSLLRIAKLSSDQLLLQQRVEQLQKLSASLPVSRTLFQDQRVVTDLFTKLHNVQITANNTSAKLSELRGTNSKLVLLLQKARTVLIQQQQRKPTPTVITKPVIDEMKLKQLIEEEIRKQISSFEPPTCNSSPTFSSPAKEIDITDYDFALATAGAEPLTDLTSPTYVPLPSEVKTLAADFSRMIGFGSSPVQDVSGGLLGSPWDALNTVTTPGSCWPMQGSSGNLTLRLDHAVTVSAISIDHISRVEAVDERSAPKEFAVYTASSSTDSWKLRYQGAYDLLTSATQTYHFFDAPEPIAQSNFVRLGILSNHGHPDYTCLYRFRVHGRL